MFQSNKSTNTRVSFTINKFASNLQEHDDLISGMALTDKHVITSSFDKSVVCVERDTLRKVRTWEGAHADLVLDIDAEADGGKDGKGKDGGNRFATCANDGVVALWDVREEKCQSREFLRLECFTRDG